MPIAEDSAITSLPDGLSAGNVIIAYEYIDGKLTAIGASENKELLNQFDQIKQLSDDDTDDRQQKRSASIGFTVDFLDGKVICENNAQKTMIEALRYMGLERASKYDETFSGYRLIGKTQRVTDDGNKWQRYVDGWWIYIILSNERKIKCLEGVAKMLNIAIKISPNGQESAVNKPTNKIAATQKRPLFSLNGQQPVWKNRTVLNAVKQFVNDFPEASLNDVENFFPRQLQGGYGVVASIEEIEERSKRNKTEQKRWFLDDDIITDHNGVKFAVSTQWGPENFARFQQHVSQQLGWTIKEL